MTMNAPAAARRSERPDHLAEPQPSVWLRIRPNTSPARAGLKVTNRPSRVAALRVARLVDPQQRDRQGDDADRHVDEEDPAPVQPARDRPAEHRADRDGDPGDRAEHAERDAALAA